MSGHVFFSPAKLNLTLRILDPRADGYHEIASLFQAIDLGDDLIFSFAEEDTLTCTDPTIPLNRDNLIWKAVNLYRERTRQPFKVCIYLIKRIPIQAGLGGGSSNGATTLFALNALHGFPIPEKELSDWGQEIGSDVPFFFSSGRAFCTGRGEKVESLAPLSGECLVVKPEGGLSTKEMYQLFDKLKPGLSLLSTGYFNDFESAAFFLRPDLALLKKELLNSGFDTVCLTGSGSAFFCLGNGNYRGDFRSYKVNFLPRSNDGAWYKRLPNEIRR